VVVLGLIITASMIPLGAASDYTIVFQGDHFNITWRIDAFQNLTGFPSSTAYPANLSASLDGQDLSAFNTALQNALQAKVNSVSISQLMVKITSNSASNTCIPTCSLQWLNLTVGFQLQESPPSNYGAARYDMSWKDVRVDDDLTAAGAGFNKLGDRYLLDGLVPMVTFTPTRSQSVLVSVQNETVNSANYQSIVSKIVLLDLSLFQAPLDNWSVARDLNLGIQTWTSPFNGGFIVSAIHRVNEPEGTTNLAYLAGAKISAQMTTPLNAFVKGDSLFVDQSGGFVEKIASAAILGILGVWIGASVIERKTAGPSFARQRKKKR